jgi:hypothetical protein
VKAEIVPASEAHVALVAANMRQADRDEIWASHHALPEDSLRRGVRNSTQAWAAIIGGEVCCLFGVTPRSFATGDGTPWMLGTDGIVRHQYRFLRDSIECADAMNREYPTLVNYVSDANEASKRWLRWLGFTLDDPAPYGIEGQLFRRFERVRG